MGGFENNRTTDGSAPVEFWVDDVHEGVAQCGFDASDWSDLADCSEGVHAPQVTLAPGTHTFWITATDTFGNLASTVYTYDVVVPASTDTGSGGPSGGAGSVSPSVSLKTKSSKVKKGKFTLTITVAATNVAECRTAAIAITPKVKKAKTIKLSKAATVKNGVCVATVKAKLSGKLKKKRATVVITQAGVTKKVTLTL
ncbi:MAG: hypothetical protein QM648_04805 [Solirubrobacterales bacterium]